ncbi:MAG: hypothetical protein SGJ10_14950 [Bacteroidota bacterium]|nr:hypothetical protein [Bacteroidota bacterium]
MSKIDKKARRDFIKNVKHEKIILYAGSEGAVSTFDFTLREHNKFASTSSAFGCSTYYTGDWNKRNNSDTIDLAYSLNHPLEDYYPYILITQQQDSLKKGYVEFTPIDATKNYTFKLPIITIDK